MAFHVGQKVVCVDDDGWSGYRKDFDYPSKGEVYTVRECIPAEEWGGAIRLCEITNRKAPNLSLKIYDEPFFRSSRFRPVQERKRETSIEVFKKLLNPTKVDA